MLVTIKAARAESADKCHGSHETRVSRHDEAAGSITLSSEAATSDHPGYWSNKRNPINATIFTLSTTRTYCGCSASSYK
jgi:hypothetical protein